MRIRATLKSHPYHHQDLGSAKLQFLHVNCHIKIKQPSDNEWLITLNPLLPKAVYRRA